MAEVNPVVQDFEALETLDAAKQLPGHLRATLDAMRTMKAGNALTAAQMPGAPAMSVEPANFSPVAVAPAAAPVAPAAPAASPSSPEAAFVEGPPTTPEGEIPVGTEAGGAVGGALHEQTRADAATLAAAARTQDPDERARANAEGLVDTMLYRGLRLPEQRIMALSFKYGLTEESPLDRKARLMREGAPGANLLPTATPSGFLETIGALTGPTDALNPIPFGLGVIGQYSTESETMGDVVQGLASVVPLAIGAVKGVRAVKPFTLNERRYQTELRYVRENQRYVELNQDIAAQVRADNAAIMQRAREAQARAEVASTQATRAAQARQNAAFAARDAARAALPTHAVDMRQRLAITPGAPSPEVAGAQLRSIDRAAGTGAHAAVKGIRNDLNTLYENTRVISDTANNGGPIRVPLESAALTSLRNRAITSLRRSLTRAGGAEEELAQRIQHLGIRGIQNPAGEYVPLDPADPHSFSRLMDILDNDRTPTGFRPVYDAPTYREISTLHAEASNIAMNPRQYGISDDRAGREFYRLVNGELKGMKLMLEQSNAALRDAAADADIFMRTRVLPMKAAAKVVKGGETTTPYGAFRSLVSGAEARGDPTHMVTMFSRMDQNERMAYQTAALDNIIRDHTTADGRVDFAAVLNDWHSAHPTWRMYMTSGSNAGAQQVMNDWVVAQRRLEAAEEAAQETISARNPLRVAAREARAEERRARVAMNRFDRDGRRVLRDAERDVREALAALHESQTRANRAGRRPIGSSERILSPNQEGKWEIAAAHAAGGLIMGATGHPVLAVSQLGIAWAAMHRPRLVAAAARMTKTDPNGPAIAGALHAVIKAYEAMTNPEAGNAPIGEDVPMEGVGPAPPPGVPAVAP